MMPPGRHFFGNAAHWRHFYLPHLCAFRPLRFTICTNLTFFTYIHWKDERTRLAQGKNDQKMAGGLRMDSGHEMYCSILTIIETLKRRMAILMNIKKLFFSTQAIF